MFLRLVTSVGQRKKFLVPIRNRTSDLRICEVHMIRVIQDAFHMNFVIDLAHRRVSVAQW